MKGCQPEFGSEIASRVPLGQDPVEDPVGVPVGAAVVQEMSHLLAQTVQLVVAEAGVEQAEDAAHGAVFVLTVE